MEKAIGKKSFAKLLSDLIIKPVGKATLVVESDKRSEINSIDSAKKILKYKWGYYMPLDAGIKDKLDESISIILDLKDRKRVSKKI